jgi:putative ABC transport system permease protein
MIKNYFKIAWRNLWRNKLYSAITISGLSLAMAGAILLLLWIQNAISIDQFHVKKDQLYKVYKNETSNGFIQTSAVLPAALADDLQKNYGEIKAVTRVGSTSKLFAIGDKRLMAGGNVVDHSFLTMFSFPMALGDVASALSNDHSLLITERLAQKIFPGTNPIGKAVLLDTENFVVTGVLKDLPNNTRFNFEFLIPWNRQPVGKEESLSNTTVEMYAELNPMANVIGFNNKIIDVFSRHSKNELHAQLFLYPLSKCWLYGDFNNGKPAGGAINIVQLLFGVAFILLLIGSINFMNLSTARGEQRAKEVGVRKIAGANKKALITQFIGESVLLATLAGIIALLLAQLLLPSFNRLIEKQLSIQFQSPGFWSAAIGFVLFTGTLAGSYPAFYLSSFKAINGLKKAINGKYALLTPRKILVVVQFVVSIVMINYSYTLIQQTKFMMRRNAGFVKNELLFHPLSNDLQKNYAVVKQQLLNTGKVVAVNKTNIPITGRGVETKHLKWQGVALGNPFELMTCDGGFVRTNGLELLAGRDIDMTAFPTDSTTCVVNEAALKTFGNKNMLGQVIEENGTTCTIVGIIKDFVNDFPGQPTSPLMVRGSNDAAFLNVRLNSKTSIAEVAGISNILKQYNGAHITELQFASDAYGKQFKGAEVSITLAAGFSGIAIFISCLGLFGLGIFMVSTRTKEIGIRKVLGAGVASISYLLTRDFIKLVTIAIVIGSPIAWILMQSAVQNFSYRINLDWKIPLVTGLVCIVVACVTVGFRSVKAAMLNPVESLKAE